MGYAPLRMAMFLWNMSSEGIGSTRVFKLSDTPRWFIKHRKNLWLVIVDWLFFFFVQNLLFIHLWLVVAANPSEKWWSESQLGWWHSQYMENKKHVPNHQPDLSVQWLLAINVETPVFREWRIVWYGWTSTFCWSIPAEFSAVNIHLILTISMVKSCSIFCGAPIAYN